MQPGPGRHVRRVLTGILAALFLVALGAASDTVPTDIKLPGTQPIVDEFGNPLDDPPSISPVGNCGCHSGLSGNPHAEAEPVFGWEGSMMGSAGRDPLFWATVAIAEQDFLPGQGGAGDLCLKCHSVKGWLEGRSTPTNGSGLNASTDTEGVMCEFCHFMVDPDAANSIPSPPEGTYIEEQHAPFLAYDEATGAGYYGGAEYVLNSGGTRMGPFVAMDSAKHKVIPNTYFREGRYCGTCHDVSNPAVGDLAHNHGTMVPLAEGTYSGIPGATVDTKAAFNNEPHTYGVVERTFSEWLGSDLDTWPVNDFGLLPPDLQVAGGALWRAWDASMRGECSSTTSQTCNVDANCSGGETCVTTTANFEDGSTRTFTCQTCHMPASGGKAARQNSAAFRTDLPRHDLTGGSIWIQDAIQWQDAAGTLRFGTGLNGGQIAAMTAAQQRAADMLQSAASLSAAQVDTVLRVRVTNLTAHKLISGYPEGRRMWINVRWYDGADILVYENGAYRPLGNLVQDLSGASFDVQSIVDVASTTVYEAEPAMTSEWGRQLLALGYPGSMILSWDRLTNVPVHMLQDLADLPAGAELTTFHFVLNNIMHHDNRIPPFGFDRDVALARSTLPVPATQFGGPGPGGAFNHWDETDFQIPAGAARAEVRLFYQSTSWEYIQFLLLQNDGSDDPVPPLGDAFLGNEGVHMLDAWLNTGMAAPFEMTGVEASLVPPAFNPPGSASGNAAAPMRITTYDSATGALNLSYAPACDAIGHTVHYGGLAGVSTYSWERADCTLGITGSDLFVPDPTLGESIFFVLVGNNPEFEGSYGLNSRGVERPPGGRLVSETARSRAVLQVAGGVGRRGWRQSGAATLFLMCARHGRSPRGESPPGTWPQGPNGSARAEGRPTVRRKRGR